MGSKAQTSQIDAYIAALAPGKRALAKEVRRIVTASALHLQEAVRWESACFFFHGPVCYIAASRGCIHLGFFRGRELADPERRKRYRGPVTPDWYGRAVPKPAHGSINLGSPTSSARKITTAVAELFDRIVDPELLVRRMYVVANRVVNEKEAKQAEADAPVQLDMFTDYAAEAERAAKEAAALEKEKRQQQAVLDIKKKYGKNAILKGMNLEEGATAKDRNAQIGGHRA